MAMRAWRVWGISAVLVGGLRHRPSRPHVPPKTEVNGKVTAADHPGPLPARASCRRRDVLPESIRDRNRGDGPETATGTSTRADIGLPKIRRLPTSTFRFGHARGRGRSRQRI